MTRLNLGFGLLVLVVAILIVAPTAVFGYLWGLEAVLHYWAWVAYLIVLTLLGAGAVFTARAKPGHPQIVEGGSARRLRLGIAAFVLVAGILVFAPTIAFGNIFGYDAVLAYWASVFLLVAMTFGGLYLVFTAKQRAQAAR
jgi:hypothetical protein